MSLTKKRKTDEARGATQNINNEYKAKRTDFSETSLIALEKKNKKTIKSDRVISVMIADEGL